MKQSNLRVTPSARVSNPSVKYEVCHFDVPLKYCVWVWAFDWPHETHRKFRGAFFYCPVQTHRCVRVKQDKIEFMMKMLHKAALSAALTLGLSATALADGIAELRKAAGQGDAKAQYHLGDCYAYGKAAAQGHVNASVLLMMKK